MPKKLKLTESQTKLKSELEIIHNKIWQYIESDQKLLSDEDASRLYDEMAKKAHELHMSLKDSGHKPKHHKYMIENRGCTPDDVRFYRYVHPVQDLLAFIDDVHANDDHKDKTIGKTFTLKFFTRRWQYIEHYKITRTEKGWVIRVLSDSYSSNKSMSPELNHLLDNDGVCYPKDINLFFEWLWDKAAEEGLTKAKVQVAINKLGKWISECEKNAPREGVIEQAYIKQLMYDESRDTMEMLVANKQLLDAGAAICCSDFLSGYIQNGKQRIAIPVDSSGNA